MDLENIPKKNCFKIPNDYFDSAENELMQKISGKAKVNYLEVFKPYLYMVAFMILLVCIIKGTILLSNLDEPIKEQHKFNVKDSTEETASPSEDSLNIGADKITDHISDN